MTTGGEKKTKENHSRKERSVAFFSKTSADISISEKTLYFSEEIAYHSGDDLSGTEGVNA